MVQWGDWHDLNFVVLVSVVGGVLLLWVLAASCDACRKRRQKNQAGFALVLLKKSGDTEAVPSSTSAEDNNNDPSSFTNSRLIGRSVWNSHWKLVIPGRTLLSDPNAGLDRFIKTVRDVKLYFVTYSYSGN